MVQRRTTIKLLEEIADELNGHNKRKNIAKIIGSGVAIGGAIVSLVAIPFTGGLSTVALIVSAALGGSGAATGLGSMGVVKLIERKLKVKAETVLEEDKKCTERLTQKSQEIICIPEKFYNGLSVAYGVVKAGTLGFTVSTKFALKVGAQVSEAVTRISGGITKIAGPVLSGISIPLSIATIVISVKDLKKKDTELAAEIRKVVTELKGDLSKKEELMDNK